MNFLYLRVQYHSTLYSMAPPATQTPPKAPRGIPDAPTKKRDRDPQREIAAGRNLFGIPNAVVDAMERLAVRNNSDS